MSVFLIHIVAVIAMALLAVLASTFLDEPDEMPMENDQQWWRNIRNLLINVSFFLFTGLMLGLVLNGLLKIISGTTVFQNDLISGIWILSGVLIGLLWANSRPLHRIPGSNSVLRTTNIFNTGQREDEEDQQGETDVAVKYRGPNLAILHPFEIDQGEIEMESRDPIIIDIKQMTFRDDVGSGKVILNYRVNDVDRYAAQGETQAERLQKVRANLDARVRTDTEAISKNYDVRDVMGNIRRYFGPMCRRFVNEISDIERILGITIQSMEVTDINESKGHAEAAASAAINTIIMNQAEAMSTKAGQDPNYMPSVKLASVIARTPGMQYTILDTPDGRPLPENVRLILGPDGKLAPEI